MKIGSHLDFQKTAQLIQVTVQKVGELPVPGWQGGLVYYNGFIWWHDGSDWIQTNSTVGLITDVNEGGGIDVGIASGVAKITFDPDNSTLELSNETDAAKARIKDGGVGNTKLATDAVSTIKIVDKNITFAKLQDIVSMTVIGNMQSADGTPQGVTVISDLGAYVDQHNTLVTARAVKIYLQQMLAGATHPSLGAMQGSFNANTSSNFPTIVIDGQAPLWVMWLNEEPDPELTRIENLVRPGDFWYVSVAGTVQGVTFNIGDAIISKVYSPSTTDPDDWIFLETNRDQATTTVLGLVKLATQAEARAMTDTQKALTPSNLADVKATNQETQTGTEANRFVTPASLSARTATEARTGIAKVATQALTDAGENDSDIVTPLKLHVKLQAELAAYGVYAANIGNGTATMFTVTHGLATKDVIAGVFANSDGQSILTDISRSNNDAVIVSFAFAPANDEFRIVIKK